MLTAAISLECGQIREEVSNSSTPARTRYWQSQPFSRNQTSRCQETHTISNENRSNSLKTTAVIDYDDDLRQSTPELNQINRDDGITTACDVSDVENYSLPGCSDNRENSDIGNHDTGSTSTENSNDIDNKKMMDVSTSNTVYEGDDRKMPDKISLGIILASSFINSFTLTVIVPTVSSYSEQLKAGPIYAGLAVGVYSIAGAFSTQVYARLAPRSFASVILFSIFTNLIGNLMYALAGLARAPVLILISRMVLGVAYGVMIVHRYFLSYTVGKHFRSNQFQLLRVSQILGYLLGPLVGAGLSYVNFRVGDLLISAETSPAWLLIIIDTFFLLFTYCYFIEPKTYCDIARASVNYWNDFKALNRNAKNTSIMVLLWGNMVASFTISSFDTAAQEISEVYFNYDIAGQGYILSGIFLPSLFTTYLSGKLSTRVEDRIQMFTSVVLIFFLSSLIYQYTHPMNQPLYIFGSASILIFANCYIALLSSKASKMIPAKDLNFTLQVQIFLSLIGRGVGPIVAKTLIVKYGPNAFGLTLTIVSFLFALYFMIHFRKL